MTSPRNAYWKARYKQQKAKFGNKRTERDGRSFGSKFEAAVYDLLKLRQKAGEISEIQMQDHVHLTVARIGYIADFRCVDAVTGESFWVEAKGFETPVWKLKLKLWEYFGPGKLEIWKGTYIRPKLAEVVVPKSLQGGSACGHGCQKKEG